MTDIFPSPSRAYPRREYFYCILIIRFVAFGNKRVIEGEQTKVSIYERITLLLLNVPFDIFAAGLLYDPYNYFFCEINKNKHLFTSSNLERVKKRIRIFKVHLAYGFK